MKDIKFGLNRGKIEEYLNRDLALWYATPSRPTPSDEELRAQVELLYSEIQPWAPAAQEVAARVATIKRIATEVGFLVLARADRGLGD